ncbi:MAG: hypothetical protein ACYCT7_01685 [bacterium]
MNINYFKNDKLKDKIIYIFIIFITFSILNYFFIKYMVYHIDVFAFSLVYSIMIIAIIAVFLDYIGANKQIISELYEKKQTLNETLNEKNDELENYNKITSKKIDELNQATEKFRDIMNQKTIQIKTLTDKHKILTDEKIKLELEMATYEERIEILISKKSKNIDNVINTDVNTDNNNEPELLIKRED